MTTSAQHQDAVDQAAELESIATDCGYETLDSFFADEPELFDLVAHEWREQHPLY